MGDHVFISHSSKDKPVADAVCATLEAGGVRCWIAPRNISPGDEYAAAIIDAINKSAAMVLVLSADSNQSPQILREVERAVNKRVPLVSVRIDATPLSKSLEFFLSASHWLDATAPPLEGHLESLAAAVARIKAGRKPADDAAAAAATQPPAATRPQLAPRDAGETRAATPPRPPPARDEKFSRAASLRGPASAPPFTFEELTRRPELLVGGRVGFYLAREFVGAGGSGMVYVATNERLGRDVCVKILYPLRARAEAVGTIIARAVRGLAALNHPNVISVSDFGVYELGADSSFYLAMDYVRGLRLDAWSAELGEGPQALARRLRAAFDLASALHAAHTCRYIDEFGMEQRGILHGDVKPANVLVRPADRLVLLDFLIVDVQRLIQRELAPGGRDDDRPITAEFGTPDFMPPEQRTRGHMTVRGDIYSLGLTFCHLFAPGAPLPGFLLQTADDGLAPLRQLIREMISDDPEARPADMSAVAERLAVFGLESNIALPDSINYGWTTTTVSDPVLAAALDAKRRAAPKPSAPPQTDAHAGDPPQRPPNFVARLWKEVISFLRGSA